MKMRLNNIILINRIKKYFYDILLKLLKTSVVYLLNI